MALPVVTLLLLGGIHVSMATLVQVNVVYRHGARSSTRPYPTAQHEEVWPQGLGQLTTVGMQQAFELGEWLRQRYINDSFMNKTYSVKQMTVRSTDFDRTLMTAQCVLSAMFPPGEAGWQQFNVQLQWQPIAIHTAPQQEDVLLAVDDPPCPVYDQAVQQFYRSTEFQSNNRSHQDFYNRMKPLAGFTQAMNPYLAWNIYDDYLCKVTNGLPTPDWLTAEDVGVIRDELIPLQYRAYFSTVQQVRLKVGVLVDQLLSNMKLAVQLQPYKRMYMYSAHDNNVILLLRALGLYGYTYLPYCSTVLLELHTLQSAAAGDDQYGVRVLYRNQSEAAVTSLPIPGCKQDPCPLSRVEQLLAPYRISALQQPQLCGVAMETKEVTVSGVSVVASVLLAVTGCLFVAVLLAVTTTSCAGRKEGEEQTAKRREEEEQPLLSSRQREG